MAETTHITPVRNYTKGMGDAVADRTINRIKESGEKETWGDVAKRVAIGNASLCLTTEEQMQEEAILEHHLRQASLLMSGRHLQHGDSDQKIRPGNVFTNCSTAGMSFLSFGLLLSGSGVGRSFEDALMLVDWTYLPRIVVFVDPEYKDLLTGEIPKEHGIDLANLHNVPEILGEQEDKKYDLYVNSSVYEVEDSREGWAKVIEKLEVMAYEKTHRDEILFIDFSKVRPRNSPIRGMQNRPASGPWPLMHAIVQIAKLRDAYNMAPWKQTMHVDHYLSECVLVGGARRAARMATKDWRDESIFEFIEIKRGGILWSANNSVCVDQEFWGKVKKVKKELSLNRVSLDLLLETGFIDNSEARAYRIFDKVCECSYFDGTGEPGFINQDKLCSNEEGLEEFYSDGEFINTPLYKLDEATLVYSKNLLDVYMKLDYKMIVNPCSEISLAKLFGLCIIADVVPFHASSLKDAEDAFRAATRALIRVNTMDFFYNKEVKRTNRIGVGITGIHEFAWRFFKLGWKDLVNENVSKIFWETMSVFARAVTEEADRYSDKLGMVHPHTLRCIKPSGSVSKLHGITEGAHLPANKEYLRWVQFRNDDPLVNKYKNLNYPCRELKTYSGTTIIGFPTQPTICQLGMEDKLVTAGNATPEEQYAWLKLLEKYWIIGVDPITKELEKDRGNSVSYTLKYNPDVVNFEMFKKTLLDGQSQIRCCSVMPQVNTSAYEYVPEQSITKLEFEEISQAIINEESLEEDIGMEHIDCAGGACPITFKEVKNG